MSRWYWAAALACAVAVTGCGGGNGGPTGPTVKPPRIARTKFLAFGDSFTAGEVTNPAAATPNGIHKLIVVPAASYPSVLQSQLRATYTEQSAAITVQNAGQPNEAILDGNLRFPNVFASSNADVVLLMEGINGLPGVGPDISTGIMRIMVQAAKNGGARVFVGSMLPQVTGRPRATTPLNELLAYNAVLQVMCTQEGVTFVDVYNAMLPDAGTLLGADGLHPTEAGYRRIADVFFTAIQRELQIQ